MSVEVGPNEKIPHAPQITVDVNEDVINRAVEKNSNYCLVAEAIKENYPHLTHICVDIQTIRASDKEKRHRYVWLTPRRVQEMIVKFDQGIKPEPCRFSFRDGQVLAVNANAKYRKNRNTSKAMLRKPKGGNACTIPERVGGKTPPKSIGQRREYGLRSFDLIR